MVQFEKQSKWWNEYIKDSNNKVFCFAEEVEVKKGRIKWIYILFILTLIAIGIWGMM